jgi:ADP-heptose:LPS heptosyltransferase
VSGLPRDAGREWLVAIRLRQLGDVLAAISVLRAIKTHRPERALAYVVDAPYAALVARVPFVDRVVVPPRRGDGRAWPGFLRDLRRLRATAAIDLHGSARSALLSVACGAPQRVGFDVRLRRLAYTIVEPRGEWRDGRRVPHTPVTWGMHLARHVGAAAAEPLPPLLACGEDERARAAERWSAAGVRAADLGHRLVGLNPGRPSGTKRWPEDRFAELARVLRERGFAVSILWGPGEEGVAREVARLSGDAATLAPPFALDELPAALGHLTALVTIESGLKHLAVCSRVPTVTVFGSTDPREWHMGTARDRVLWRGLSCSPCRRTACPFGTPCMDVSTAEVLDRLDGLLENAA